MPQADKYMLVSSIAIALVAMGAWQIVVAWCVLSMLLCGLSYAYFGVHILNKSQEGNFPFLSLVANAPWRWEYTAVVAFESLRRTPASNEIRPGLWLGRYPMKGDLPEGVKLVVDLTAVLPKPKVVSENMDYLCLPTLDGYAPEAGPFLELVEKVARYEDPVLIHCARGRGRSATFMAAVLVKRGLASDVEQANAMMQEARPCVRLHRQQLELLNALPLERIA